MIYPWAKRYLSFYFNDIKIPTMGRVLDMERNNILIYVHLQYPIGSSKTDRVNIQYIFQ